MTDKTNAGGESPAKNYTEATKRIDEILAGLEQTDRVDVDHLAERVAEASELIRYCRSRLRETEIAVTRIVDELAAEAPPESDGSAQRSAGSDEEEIPF